MKTKHLVSVLAATMVMFAATTVLAQNLAYLPPPGGWLYAYTGDVVAYGSGFVGGSPVFDSLDGYWNRGNGSDAWDGSAIGSPAPGGLTGLTEGALSYLRMQDAGDPRQAGYPDPSNRKLYFAANLTSLGAPDNLLNSGVTLSFRARVPTSGTLDNITQLIGGVPVTQPYPAGGNGYAIHDNGKGNFGIRQLGGGGGIISFSLTTAFDPLNVLQGIQPGLIMNNLNGNVNSGVVDSNEAGTRNFLPFDSTQWHEFWITIQSGGSGTHVVKIYMDGSLVANSFDVTAGTGTDGGINAYSYLAMGLGNTQLSGALDVDFVAVKPGVFAPEPIPEPSALGLVALGLLAVGIRRWRQA